MVRRWVYVTLAVLVSVAVLVPAARLHTDSRSSDDVAAQLHHLRDRLDDGSAADAQQLFPEGYFFSHVLYGLGWLDVGTARPATRAEALREARWALRRLDSAAGRAPFTPGLRPAYGVFYVGWTSRLRGGIVRLAGAGAPEAARLDRDCAALARAFAAEGPFLAAYPGRAWPVDSVVAVAALRLRDQVGERPAHRAVVEEWLRQAKARTDPATGLLPHEATAPPTGARGSSQSVIQRFLPEIDLGWARQQYERFRTEFVTTRLGLPGVLEYPRGSEGAGDVDSGPLILGVSASATVVTLGRRAQRATPRTRPTSPVWPRPRACPCGCPAARGTRSGRCRSARRSSPGRRRRARRQVSRRRRSPNAPCHAGGGCRGTRWPSPSSRCAGLLPRSGGFGPTAYP